jgi:hypothetical protein
MNGFQTEQGKRRSENADVEKQFRRKGSLRRNSPKSR